MSAAAFVRSPLAHRIRQRDRLRLGGLGHTRGPGQAARHPQGREAFHTEAGEVHNVKSSNAGAPSKTLASYIAKKGAALEDLAVPAK
jgi:hypothetical protein